MQPSENLEAVADMRRKKKRYVRLSELRCYVLRRRRRRGFSLGGVQLQKDPQVFESQQMLYKGFPSRETGQSMDQWEVALEVVP